MGELQEDSFLTFGDYAAGLKSLHPGHYTGKMLNIKPVTWSERDVGPYEHV